MNRSNEEESFKNIVIKIDKKKQIVSCYFPSTSLSFMASNTERYPADVFNTWMENVDWNWRFEIFKESEEFFFFSFSFHSQRWKIQGRTGWIFQPLFETTRSHGVSRSLIKPLASTVNRTNCNENTKNTNWTTRFYETRNRNSTWPRSVSPT